MIRERETGIKALEVIGAKEIKGYTLVNNWGYTFKVGDRKYDVRYWANCYGVALNYWRTHKCGERERDDLDGTLETLIDYVFNTSDLDD